jgi:hypothetical protein
MDFAKSFWPLKKSFLSGIIDPEYMSERCRIRLYGDWVHCIIRKRRHEWLAKRAARIAQADKDKLYPNAIIYSVEISVESEGQAGIIEMIHSSQVS